MPTAIGCEKNKASARCITVRTTKPYARNPFVSQLHSRNPAYPQTCVTANLHNPIGYYPAVNYQSLERRGYTWLVYLVGGFRYKADHHDARGAMRGVDRSIEKVDEWDYLRTRTDTHELEERECGEGILYSLCKPTVSYS